MDCCAFDGFGIGDDAIGGSDVLAAVFVKLLDVSVAAFIGVGVVGRIEEFFN